MRPRQLQASETAIHRLQIDGPRPALGDADNEPVVPEGEDALESWSVVLQEILQCWI